LTTAAPYSFGLSVRDAFGNVVPTYTGTVHFTINVANDVVPVNYTFKLADAGKHEFSYGLTLKAAGSATLTVTDTVKSSLTGSQTFSVTIGATQFAVTGFPASVTAGTAQSLTVTATDPYGKVATGYTGTAHFISTDKQAALPSDYTFLSSDSGAHVFTGVILRTAGSQSITATDTVNGSLKGSQKGILVTPASAIVLKVAPSTGTTTAGASFSATVTALDPYGNIATGYAGTVTFSSSDPQAVLPANYAFTSTDAGKHTFSNGIIFKTVGAAGSQTVTAADTVTASIAGTSAAVIVNPAGVDHLAILTPTSSTAGAGFSVTVTAQDVYNNTTNKYGGTIHFTSTDAKAVVTRQLQVHHRDQGDTHVHRRCPENGRRADDHGHGHGDREPLRSPPRPAPSVPLPLRV
jgi:hypothetical protein